MEDDDKIGVCDVHKYALNDNGQYPVSYCSICDAWICDKCSTNLPLRAVAAFNKKKETMNTTLNAGGAGRGGRGGRPGGGRGWRGGYRGYGYGFPYYPVPLYYVDDMPAVIEGVNDFQNATGSNNDMAEAKKVWESLNKMPEFVKFLPLLGVAGGLYYAFTEKKSVSAYIGFALVGAIVFSAPYNYYLLENSEKLNSK